MEKRKFIGYNPEQLKSDIDRFVKLGFEFTLKITKSLTTLKMYETEIVYQNCESKGNMNLLFIIGMVRKDIDSYYNDNGHNFDWRENYPAVTLCKKETCTQGEKIGLDINLCYWTTAYNLGFISEKTFKRGSFFRNQNLDDALLLNFIGKRNYKKAKELNLSFEEAYNNGLVKESDYKIATTNLKQGLVMSIGCLIQRIEIEHYNANGLVEKKIDEDFIFKYKPFHRAILGKVEKLMNELSLLDGFCFFETDCVFFDAKHKPKFERLLDKYNYQYKQINIKVNEISDNRVTFFDYKKNKTRGITF